MLISLLLLSAYVLTLTQGIIESDEFPCPNTLLFHSTTVSTHEQSCKRVSHLALKQIEARSKRIVKRQIGLGGFGNPFGGFRNSLPYGPPDASISIPERLLGCANEEQRQIIQHVVGPLLSDGRMRIGEIAKILQQSLQQVTGRAFEVIMGKQDPVIASHHMSQASHCREIVRDYYVAVYTTPVLYVITNVAQEQEMSNIDFGEPNGGNGYPGQVPFPQISATEAALINLNAALGAQGLGGIDQGVLQGLAIGAGVGIGVGEGVGVGAGGACFSGDSIVHTIGGPKRMTELQHGDEVMSFEESTITFSPIIMFLHRDDNIMAEFNIISTDNGEAVKLTNEHLIYVSDCVSINLILVSAKDVTNEHCLMIRSPFLTLSIERVINVTKTYERGVYAPLTATSDIIVNDVLSSCHSNLAVRTLQQSFFSVYRFINQFLSFTLPREGAIPIGVQYIASVLDLFIPVKPVMV